MKEVGNFTRATPQARVQGMQSFINRIETNEEARKILSDWGLSLAPHAITLNGRMLERPTLHFGAGQSERLTRWENLVGLFYVLSCEHFQTRII